MEFPTPRHELVFKKKLLELGSNRVMLNARIIQMLVDKRREMSALTKVIQPFLGDPPGRNTVTALCNRYELTTA